jgi:hypothetical protein
MRKIKKLSQKGRREKKRSGVRRIRQRGTAAKGKEESRTQEREEAETSADRRRRKPELGTGKGEDDIDGDDIPRVPPLVG